MAIASNASLLDALRQYRLLEPVQLEEITRNVQARFSDPPLLAGELIQRKWLTPYQANQLLQGRGEELLLGSYVLLETLGEGGMGQVFKARNWKLGRVVALKLIRKERLESPDAVRRFQREIQAAAALSHPNIVHAYDADQIGGTHLLVMECIEGATDLARLVKKNGPLPVAQASDYVRQAALGLQHAFERGMVHRDIKPANLLLTADGKMVKILDMGLARLARTALDGAASSTMTQEGAIMGTPDYIAPEQAVESHTVDIRADLYSLGCTFYFLLAGRVPFPGGTLIQKINKHQFEEPHSVQRLRPDVPPGIARVVRKLMAKKPEDRYQTPGEAATALASAFSPDSGEEGTVPETWRAMVVAANPAGPSERVNPRKKPWRGDRATATTPGPKVLGVKDAHARGGLSVGMMAVIGGILLLGSGVIAFLVWGCLPKVEFRPTPEPERPAREIRVGPSTPRGLGGALYAARPGDRIILETDITECDLSVTKANITIEAASGKKILWKCPASAQPDPKHWYKPKLIILQEVSGVTIKGVTLDGEHKTEALILVYGKCPGVKLENLHLQNSQESGVLFVNCEGDSDNPVQLVNLDFQTSPGASAVRFIITEAHKTIRRNRFIAVRNCTFNGQGIKLTTPDLGNLDPSTLSLPKGLTVEVKR